MKILSGEIGDRYIIVEFKNKIYEVNKDGDFYLHTGNGWAFPSETEIGELEKQIERHFFDLKSSNGQIWAKNGACNLGNILACYVSPDTEARGVCGKAKDTSLQYLLEAINPRSLRITHIESNKKWLLSVEGED